MKSGTEFQCEIESCAFGGDGIARHGGEVVFIPGALPGEKIIARITAEKKNFSRAEIVRIGVRSPERTVPRCPLAAGGRCNCVYQHISCAGETALKAEQLTGMCRTAGITLPAGGAERPSVPSRELGYRNKLVLHFHRAGRIASLGYVSGGTVLDVPECPLAMPPINEKLAALRGDASFMHSLHEGMDVTFRYTEHDGVVFFRNRAPVNATWLREMTAIGELSVPVGGFFQVNPEGGAELLRLFQEELAELGCARTVDLYSGAAPFGCCAAAAGVPEVIAVESDEQGAAAAKYNLGKFRSCRARVVPAAAGDALPDIIAECGADTVTVVDPPRGGLDAASRRAVAAGNSGALVYISCNPATWCRDGLLLQRSGWRLTRLKPVNMFPRTAHFELFSVWRKN